MMQGVACPFVSVLLATASPVTSTPEPEPHCEPEADAVVVEAVVDGLRLSVLSRAPLRTFHTLMLPSSAPVAGSSTQ